MGSLLDLVILDTRQYDRSITGISLIAAADLRSLLEHRLHLENCRRRWPERSPL
jgi:hypothetical protein